jgi:alpha-1,3-rhamnosyl/mannosyltransferase
MANVCFDLSAAVQQSSGISRYERQLVKALIERYGAEHYSFFYTSPKPVANVKIAPEIVNLPSRARITGNKRWRLNLLLKHLAHLPSDSEVFPSSVSNPRIFHGLDYIAPWLKAPTVITVFDLSFLHYPQFHSFYNRNYLRFTLPIYARQAKRIIAISESTGRDLVKWLGPGISDKIRVTPLGVSDESYFEDLPKDQIEADLAKYGLQDGSYILCVGTLEPRKNQAHLVKAYGELLKIWPAIEQSIPTLVFVGRKGWGGEYKRVLAAIREYSLSLYENPLSQQPAPGVVILTQVEDNSLKALYQGALVCCYPSFYEGFGLPALEAMAAGTPLITSTNSSLPEITGPDREAALLVEPDNLGQLIQALKALLENSPLARQLSLAGRERARLFTWQRTAELTQRVYQEINGQY